MRKITFLILIVLSAVLISQVTLPRNETVYVIGALWGPATTWNLYAPQSTYGTDQFLYIPLFMYNIGKDAWLPLIGESYEFVNDKTIRIKIRDEAKWNDGVPITAHDVVYTLELTKKLGIGPSTGWWDYIECVKAIDDKTVEFKANEKNLNYFMFLNYSLGAKPMPKHVYSKLEEEGINIKDWRNDDPKKQVVSGPYKLFHTDPNMVAYVRIDNWWGKDIFGLPRPKYIANVIYKDNPSANLAFERGDADWAGTFIPSVWELWTKKKQPIGTWFDKPPYYMPDGVVLLYINYTKYPLNDRNVRKAVAYAIPYEDMLKKAYFGYSPQGHPSMVIDLFEPYKQWIDFDLAKETWETEDGKIPTDLEKANKILDEAGFKRGKDGVRIAPDGTRLGPYTISVPYGWTDWMMMCEMIAKNLRDIGIDIKTEFPDFSVWWDRLIKGNFDFMIAWSAGPGFDHPFNVYRFVLDSRLTGPVGEAFPAGNWERYHNDEVIELLNVAVSSLDPEQRKKTYFKIQNIIYKDLPGIVLFYGAHWYEYNKTIWTNWPNAKNPWWYPVAPWHLNALPVTFGIHKVEEIKEVPKWLETVDKGGFLIPTSKIMSDLQNALK